MSTPDAPAPPPGWYPDPQEPTTQRWWDGTQWTAYQRPGATDVTAGQQPGTAMSASEERNWILAAHLLALPAAFFVMAFLGPLLVLLIKGGESPLIRRHAVAALNFHLSWLLWGFLLVVATFVLLLVVVGLVLIPVLIAGGFAWLVIVIMASVKAGNGDPEPFNYPLTISFVK